MSMALACHGGPSIAPLTTHHLTAVQTMWDEFDLVGVTEHFDEFLVLLSDLVGLQAPAYPVRVRVRATPEPNPSPNLVGLQAPAYRSQLATPETVKARVAAQRWTARSCASLTQEPPAELLRYIAKRMSESAKSAEDFKRAKGKADSRGPAGMMDCAGYSGYLTFTLTLTLTLPLTRYDGLRLVRPLRGPRLHRSPEDQVHLVRAGAV